MEDASDRNLLGNCPACSYALRGLPVRHVCPECGLEFDRRWRVFGRVAAASNSKWMIRFIIGCVCTILVFGLDLVPLVLRVIPARLHLAFLLLLISLTALFGVMWVRNPAAFVAVGPAGVLIYRGPRRVERHGWTEIGPVQVARFNQSLVMPIGGKDVELSFVRFFAGAGGGTAEADRFSQFVNRHVRNAAADGRAPE